MSNQAYTRFSPSLEHNLFTVLWIKMSNRKDVKYSTMKKTALLLLILVLATFTSCQKFAAQVDENTDNEITDPQVKKMTDLIVSDEFNWKTTTDINVSLKASKRGVFLINTTDNNTYQKGMLFAGKEHNTKITIPSYVNKIELIFNGQTYEVVIENNKIEYDFK